jgi:GNAT superfamily N-acetyltransferase
MDDATIQFKATREIPAESIIALYQAVGWSAAEKPDLLRQALANSHLLVSAWDRNSLVGLGNTLSDGHLVVYYSHLLVLPPYQRRGIGRRLMRMLMARYEGFHQHVLIADGRAIDFLSQVRFHAGGKDRAHVGLGRPRSVNRLTKILKRFP